ncbi:Hypothetical protein PHPALM_1680 [Phytophthora palmivora]|uniref:Ndc10 domain-containing protein n=1 Tax=Phytophthora palmivora TaxID=4796 RepID=A0A2P4YRU8_9STRA|nr:Hypothetical protein PHPALM_1680 [Phytophthora palmivora]
MQQPALQVELEESANATLDRCRGARPVNTTRAYAHKQSEFKAWCDRKGFHEITRYQVTASRMHLFRQEEAVHRKIRVKGSARKVGVSTVEMYVNAISNLYSDQHSANADPHPRNSLIKALLGSLKREKHKKNKRGVYGMLSTCDENGSNQYGRREFGSCIRHTNVEVCPIGALALYFFFRWYVQMESIPDFLQPQKWYDVKVLRSGKEPTTTAVSYRANYDATAKAFTSLNMYSKAKTQAARGSGSRMAEVAGATDSQIRRLGRWNASAMEGCYLTVLPREAMRSLAGLTVARFSWNEHRSHLPKITSVKYFLLLKTICQPTCNS